MEKIASMFRRGDKFLIRKLLLVSDLELHSHADGLATNLMALGVLTISPYPISASL